MADGEPGAAAPPRARRAADAREVRSDADPVRAAVAGALEATRARTLALVAALPAERLGEARPPLGPPLWDLGHVAHFEQEWALVRLGAAPAIEPQLATRYDPERHGREQRSSLERLEAVLEALARVREAVLARVAAAPAVTGELEQRGWVWNMLRRHEEQHAEILLQWAQLAGLAPGLAEIAPPALPNDADEAELVALPGGRVAIGDDAGVGYDNERPAHERTLAPFAIERWPVTCGRYRAFVEAGGYGDPRWWSDEGCAWLARAGRALPRTWRRDGAGFSLDRFGALVPLDAREPVQHLSAHEADAFARWSGARLPTEFEWEAAERHGALGFARGAVWQWTSSAFEPYDGFCAWPYEGYSAAHFGRGHRVLRGGAWTVGDDLARASYRNWDLAERDQLFAGVRLARDVATGGAR